MGSMAYAAAALVIGAASYQAVEQRQQGIATDKMDRQKARVEAMNATQRQIDMREKMLRNMAAANAQAGVGGVGTGRSTSFGANALRQISQEQNDLMVSRANSSAQVSLLDQAGANAAAAGTANAVGTLANTASSFVKKG